MTPLMLAIAACAGQGPTAGVGTSIANGYSRKPTAIATPTLSNGKNSGSTGGSGTYSRGSGSGGGGTGVIATPTPRPIAPLRARVTLTSASAPPGQWANRGMLNPPVRVYLTPNDERLPPDFVYMNSEGVMEYPDLPAGSYHLVYNDGQLDSYGLPDAMGRSRLDMVGFYVSEVVRIDEFSRPANDRFEFKTDLHWETQAFPFHWDLRTSVEGHNPGEFISYQDRFNVKAREYAGLDAGAVPDAGKRAMYRFVVFQYDSSRKPLWYSAWTEPDANTGMVSVPWNGYTSDGSGPANMPDENDSRNSRLREGAYYFAVQFCQKGPNGVMRFPEYTTNIRAHDRQGSKFINNFYGASQFYAFTLKQGVKPSASPSPSPTASPSATP
ncbi:MAG TPA: hypothetical protein V6D00_15075 [Pantanalinema sp.]